MKISLEYDFKKGTHIAICDNMRYETNEQSDELALWESCQHFNRDVFEVFKNWITTNNWFGYDSTNQRRMKRLTNYLNGNWVSDSRMRLRRCPSYYQFVIKYHKCLANHVSKYYYCGLDKINK
jgi:hypothetical protein